MSSLCSERKTTWRGVNSTTSEALANYWFRKIIANVLSLFFSQIFVFESSINETLQVKCSQRGTNFVFSLKFGFVLSCTG